MEKLEERSGERTKRQNIRKIILQTVAAVGLLSVALLAPNALQVLSALGYKPGKNKNGVIWNSRRRLVEKGLLKYEGKFLKLTEKGERVLRRFELCDYKIKPPRKWDKKWRIIIFDIKETKRSLRDKMRKTLFSAGFIYLQKSVWIYPYPCEDLVTLLKSEFEIGKDLLYIIADEVENDKWLKQKFKLEEFSQKPATRGEKIDKAIGKFLFPSNG